MDEVAHSPADNTYGSVAIHKSLLTISYLPNLLTPLSQCLINICPLVKWPLEFHIDVKFVTKI